MSLSINDLTTHFIASDVALLQIYDVVTFYDVMDTMISLLTYGRHIQISPRSIGWVILYLLFIMMNFVKKFVVALLLLVFGSVLNAAPVGVNFLERGPQADAQVCVN